MMKNYDVIILTESKYAGSVTENSDNKTVLQEDRIVENALIAQGLRTKRVAWDDPRFNWESTTYILFRSTWDYYYRQTEFLEWLDKVSTKTKMINSENLIRWNIEKNYLIALQNKGIRLAPTYLVDKGDTQELKSWCKKYKLRDFVLKPLFSGAARHTYKISEDTIEDYEALFQGLVQQEAMMLQAFQYNIVSQGEKSLMFFDGSFSHAVLKVAKTGDFRVQDDFGGKVYDYDPTKTEIEFALKTIKACPELPHYARVDIFNDNNGRVALAELELIEPELWFRNRPEAANDLAKSIKNRIRY